MKTYLGLNSETNFDHEIFTQFDGVGMIRGENLCVNKMQYFTVPEFCQYVTNYLSYISKVFEGKPVWYRTADLVQHQIDTFEGCDGQVSDDHYLIGERGIRRNLLFRDTYEKELDAFLEARKNHPNLNLLIPFVSNTDEIKQVKEILERKGYDGKLGIMVELPSTILMLDEMNALGVDYYTIGVNDLTTMILGANRDISAYRKNDLAVRRAIKYAVEKIHSFGKEVTIAGYLNKELRDFAEEIHADNVSIHYNEIPLIWDNLDEKTFSSHYKEIKRKYKEKKKEKQRIDEIKDFLKKKYLIDGDINCVSRLIKKNLVFHADLGYEEVGIKVYLEGEDKVARFIKENALYDFFRKYNIINVPKKMNDASSYGPVMIMEWVKGESIKKRIKNRTYPEYEDNINNMLKDINRIHSIPKEYLPFLQEDKLGIEKRLNIPLEEIKRNILERKSIDPELLTLYDNLREIVEVDFNTVINSDISAHEYIIDGDRGVWIDFERFTIGDPNNDLARCFMSLTNGIVDREDEIEKIFELFKNNPNYNETTFLYYLTEKLLCSIHDAPEQISNKEIDFFKNFIESKLSKNKVLKKGV